MKRFFDSSPPLLNPADMVLTFTGQKAEKLSLPERVIITFDTGDLKRILNQSNTTLIDAWSHFKRLYKIAKSNTIITKSYFGGPNVAALIEELASFGVKECVLWGYCGGIDNNVDIGDIILTKGALREDGVSYHYIEDIESFIYSDWFDVWKNNIKDWGFQEGVIWSCDAIYRETSNKIEKYREMGIAGVEMEVASFYAVCKYRKIKGIAFLIVSDIFRDGRWVHGFFTKPFQEGVKKLSDFMLKKVIC